MSNTYEADRLSAAAHVLFEYRRVLLGEGAKDETSNNPIVQIRRAAVQKRADEVLDLEGWLKRRAATLLSLAGGASTEVEIDSVSSNYRQQMEANKPIFEIADFDVGKLMDHIDGAKALTLKATTLFRKRGRDWGEKRAFEYLLALETIDFLLDKLRTPREL